MLNNFSLSYRQLWTVGSLSHLVLLPVHIELSICFIMSCVTLPVAAGKAEEQQKGAGGAYLRPTQLSFNGQNFWLHFAVGGVGGGGGCGLSQDIPRSTVVSLK